MENNNLNLTINDLKYYLVDKLYRDHLKKIEDQIIRTSTLHLREDIVMGIAICDYEINLDTSDEINEMLTQNWLFLTNDNNYILNKIIINQEQGYFLKDDFEINVATHTINQAATNRRGDKYKFDFRNNITGENYVIFLYQDENYFMENFPNKKEYLELIKEVILYNDKIIHDMSDEVLKEYIIQRYPMLNNLTIGDLEVELSKEVLRSTLISKEGILKLKEKAEEFRKKHSLNRSEN
jgi:hypothetical protein